ncbi:hypothetical protein D3C75_1077010 [compost metagenome]
MRAPCACCTWFSALRSPKGTLMKSPGNLLKPRRTAGPSLADRVPRVRPWKALCMTTTKGCSMPLLQPCSRAIFNAVSLASAPELLKNARSMPASPVSLRASCCCQSML